MPDIHAQDDEPRKICLVCGFVLDYHGATGTYEHNFSTVSDGLADHPVIPVLVAEAPEQLQEKCDFCFADETSWVVPARTFQMPHVSGHVSTGDWAACAHCGPLIAKDRWNELFRRVKVSWEARNGAMAPMVETSVKSMHRTLRKNITGAPYEGNVER